jgi:hypothetical protein
MRGNCTDAFGELDLKDVEATESKSSFAHRQIVFSHLDQALVVEPRLLDAGRNPRPRLPIDTWVGKSIVDNDADARATDTCGGKSAQDLCANSPPTVSYTANCVPHHRNFALSVLQVSAKRLP